MQFYALGQFYGYIELRITGVTQYILNVYFPRKVIKLKQR